MATTRKTAARPVKRTKAEVEKEFEQVRSQVEDARETASPKLEEMAKLHEAEVRQAVDGVSVESVVQRISGLGLDVSKALSSISGQLVDEVGRLTAIREAVEIERRELERLHHVDVAATALDELVREYDRRRRELEEEIAARQAATEDQARIAERERKEQEEALKKQRQREIDDYEYRKTLERKKAQDRYDEEMRTLERKNQEKQETLERSWQQREAALKEQEEELAQLRKDAQTFPQKLQKEMDRAAAEAARQTEARFEQQMLILKKDAEAEARLAQLRIKALEDTLAQQTALITSLQKQLDEAKQQVQDIAVKAIEGASGARALAHVNQIAIEQAKRNAPQN